MSYRVKLFKSVSQSVSNFKVGDTVYSRLSINKIGAFAEYVVTNENTIAHLPANNDLKSGAALAALVRVK